MHESDTPLSGTDVPASAPPPTDVWGKHAGQWRHIGGPLRPCGEDIDAMRATLPQPEGHGLLLGVTPELTLLSKHMTAVERNPDMAARLWQPRNDRQRLCLADWREMAKPLSTERFDFAVGDGILNMLPFPDGYRTVLQQLELLLRPEAPFITRLYATPAPEGQETVTEVMNAARTQRIGTFHAFKWRLAMAMVAEQGNPEIAVSAIHKRFQQEAPNRTALVDATKWPAEEIDTIDAYAHSAAVYSFPTLAECTAILPPHWRIDAITHNRYELAERCPILTLRHG